MPVRNRSAASITAIAVLALVGALYIRRQALKKKKQEAEHASEDNPPPRHIIKSRFLGIPFAMSWFKASKICPNGEQTL
jgi:hypothetical protein